MMYYQDVRGQVILPSILKI